MMWFLIGLALGFLLGSTAAQLRLQQIYTKRLEHVANLAAMLVQEESARLEELKRVAKEIGQAVAAIRMRKGMH
jgi:glucose-6-phosphate-specific signal transduction histidine kinase